MSIIHFTRTLTYLPTRRHVPRSRQDQDRDRTKPRGSVSLHLYRNAHPNPVPTFTQPPTLTPTPGFVGVDGGSVHVRIQCGNVYPIQFLSTLKLTVLPQHVTNALIVLHHT
jgi:hypothetical protein